MSGIVVLALGTMMPSPTQQQSDAQTRAQYQQQAWLLNHCDLDGHGHFHCPGQ
jgi:hypothetical protein